MINKKTFDVIVIGSGSAGFSAIEAARSRGASVCVIEKDRLGGECPNYACVPSKALLRAAAVYRQAGAAKEFGIEVSGRAFEWKRVMQYRQSVMETITGKGDVGDRYIAILKQLKAAYRLGKAEFIDAHTIEVAGECLNAKTFVIATGTTDFIPPIPGLEKISFVGWKDALRLPRQPKSMAIIGGGPVGCELATLYASFGTRVVLLQGASAILNREDEEISARAQTALTVLGVEVVVGASVEETVNGHVGVSGLRVRAGTQERMYAVEQVVVAAGKRARTQGLGLEAAGVKLDDRGSLQTDPTGRTSAEVPAADKARISHRGRALRLMLPRLRMLAQGQ
jgi:pyruvate/2-oxoglutarate dehydrogenase complex dihydrolipoamide dehydrogenase (E3) component